MGPLRLPDLKPLVYWAIFGILAAWIGGFVGLVVLAVWLFRHLAWV
jgi:hypothetical protein